MEITNTKQQLFRYRRPNDYTLDELEHGYIYFPSNRELNDPFDASHRMLRLTGDNSEMDKLYHQVLDSCPDELTKNYFRRTYENEHDLLRDFVEKSTEKFVSTYGISCFTVTPLHIPLWATYADNHEGLCIQYDVRRDKKFFKNARRVDYVDNLDAIDYCPITDPQGANDIFYKKLNLWEKEYEVRLIKSSTGRHKLDPKCVRSIVLGLRAKEDFVEKVIDIIRRKYKHATLYATEVMTEKAGLSFIPYNL